MRFAGQRNAAAPPSANGRCNCPSKSSLIGTAVADRRLLIIDDEPDIGAILAYIAEDCGYEVAATISADEFKDAYATFRPTVLVVDLALPNIDGIELFRWLADQGCAMPILILSGFDDKVLESAKLLGEA